MNLTDAQLIDALTDADVWSAGYENEPDASILAAVRDAAALVEDEDAAADAVLVSLLEGPREHWMKRLSEHPEWRSAGLSRKLSAQSYPALDRMPPDALAITELAVEVGQHLEAARYSDDVCRQLLGTAWRERAYALFYVGRFHESLTACDRADAAFAGCIGDDYERARVALTRALALRPLDRLDEAESLARWASNVFADYGDVERVVLAAITDAQMLAKRHDYRAALERLLEVEAAHGDELSAKARATLEDNLGYNYRMNGDVERSIARYGRAAALHEELGSATESLRVRWNLASLLMLTGKPEEALRALQEIRPELAAFAMMSEVGVLDLERTELLVAMERYDEAIAICLDLRSRLASSGLATSTRALTAVAYLTEALQSRAATTKIVQHVREYVKRLPAEPELLFLPME